MKKKEKNKINKNKKKQKRLQIKENTNNRKCSRKSRPGKSSQQYFLTQEMNGE